MNLKDRFDLAYQAFVARPPEGEISEHISPFHDRFALLPWNPDDLVATQRMAVYENMMLKDDQVKACLFLKKHAVLSSGWNINIGEDTDAGEMQKRFIEYCFGDGMRGNFMRVLMGIQSAYGYGFSVSEKNFKTFEGGPFAGKLGLASIKTRPPDSFDGGLLTDVHGNLETIQQQGQTRVIEIPIEKAIVYSYNSEFDNPYGNSDLRAAYRFYFAKDMIIKFWNIFLERFGMPLVVGTYEKGTSAPQRTKFKKVIKNLQAKTGITIPKTMEMKFLEATRKGEAGYQDAIQEYNKSIARSVLIPDLMGFTDTKFGSRALGSEQGDVFSFILGFLKQELQEIIFEDIIRELIDKNFGPQERYPKLVFNPLSEDNKNEMTKLIIEAKAKGVIVMSDDDEAHVREMLNLPKKRKDEAGKRPAEPISIGVSPEPGDRPEGEPEGEGAPAENVVEGVKLNGAQISSAKEVISDLIEDKIPELVAVELLVAVGINAEKANQIIQAAVAFKATKSAPELVDHPVDENPPLIQLKEYYREGHLFLRRPLNKHEQKFDFAETDERMNSAIEDDVRMGSKILSKTLDDLIRTVVNQKIIEENNTAAINKLELTQMGKLEKMFNDGLKETYGDGGFIAGDAVSKKNQNFKNVTGFGVPPEKAIAWFKSQKFIMRNVIDNKLLERAKEALAVGMRSGKTTKEVINHLEEIFQDYIVGAVEANRSFAPWALTNVVQTNYNTAFNRGLQDTYNSTDLVEAFMYSAILDAQTTEYCIAMDGQIWTKSNPNFVFPSSHFQCRSDVVPILQNEPRQLSEEDALSPRKVKIDEKGKIVTKNGVPVRTSERAIRTKEFGGRD
jgi:SPP1 gp7 family putative phage head morphogenesis protein